MYFIFLSYFKSYISIILFSPIKVSALRALESLYHFILILFLYHFLFHLIFVSLFIFVLYYIFIFISFYIIIFVLFYILIIISFYFLILVLYLSLYHFIFLFLYHFIFSSYFCIILFYSTRGLESICISLLYSINYLVIDLAVQTNV